jgi:hypothetical protein
MKYNFTFGTKATDFLVVVSELSSRYTHSLLKERFIKIFSGISATKELRVSKEDQACFCCRWHWLPPPPTPPLE